MKPPIIFSILLLPSILFGQIINHFNNSDSKWYVAKTHPAANPQHPDFVATTTTVFGFQGDTLINGEQWFKLYATNDSLFQSNLAYCGLIREENNKVFYLDTSNQAGILYDFSLNVGDSVLCILYGTYPEWLKVMHVDSMLINGSYYKRIKFAEPTIQAFDKLNEIWIEGTGSIHGSLFPAFPVRFSQEIPDSMLLTCSFSHNQQVYRHQSYPACYVDIVHGLHIVECFDLKIYPNPFTDRFFIENTGSQHYELTILNSSGLILKRLQANNYHQIIDLTELKAGIYYLRVDNPLNVKTIKIIKL